MHHSSIRYGLTTVCVLLGAAAGPAAAAPPPVTGSAEASDPYRDTNLIGHLEWAENRYGPQLLIHPSAAGRADFFPTAGDRAWQEVLQLNPAADTPGMYEQFLCHWYAARLVQPDKPTWDLEPWRPPVGLLATVQAKCNPGDPET